MGNTIVSVDVSVIIPTYKRDFLLAQCLHSLFDQDYSEGKIELIVIDDSGIGLKGEVLSHLASQHCNLCVLTQEHKGPAAARNLGVQSSRGRIICFIDDDCVARKDWMRSMVRQHEVFPDIAAVGGFTRTSTDSIPVLLGQFLANNSIQVRLNGKLRTIFFPTCNVSFKRHVFTSERFNEHFPLPGGEDLELFWRLYKAGYRFRWDKDIQVIHHRQDTLLSCLQQAYIYGRGNFLAQHIHQDQPLLHELKTGAIAFWPALVVNFFKIPRFSFLQGRALIKENRITSIHRKTAVYVYFFLYKFIYITGNINEYFRVRKDICRYKKNGAA